MSAESNVPLGTLIKIAKGQTTSPRLDTYIKLDRWHSATFDKHAA